MNQFLKTAELQEMFGYKTIASLELFLIKNKIRYIRGHGTITTSTQAIDEAMPKNSKQILQDDDFEP